MGSLFIPAWISWKLREHKTNVIIVISHHENYVKTKNVSIVISHHENYVTTKNVSIVIIHHENNMDIKKVNIVISHHKNNIDTHISASSFLVMKITWPQKMLASSFLRRVMEVWPAQSGFFQASNLLQSAVACFWTILWLYFYSTPFWRNSSLVSALFLAFLLESYKNRWSHANYCSRRGKVSSLMCIYRIITVT